MNSIEDLLKNKKPHEPAQVAALKKYVYDNYKETIAVRVASKHYLITVPGAALAQRLRVETKAITEECNLDKKLVIHIGY